MKLIQKTMISTYLTRNRFVTLLIFVGMLAFYQSAHAQDVVSLSVSPAIFEMNANPAQTWESTLRVINNNPFELTVYAEVVNFRPAGEDGSAQFIALSDFEPDSTLGHWIAVPKTALIIAPESILEIPLAINLPNNTPPGGHYAAVLIGTRPPEDQNSTTRVVTSQVVSSLIFLRVAGGIVESGSIRGFRALQAIVEKPEVEFELRFQNSGNVHIRPEGEIRIFNMWGQERGMIPVNQKTLFGNILSDSIRSFRFTWEGEWSPVDIGRYRAEATLAYGEDARQFSSSTAVFWIIPWRILLGITLAIFIIGALIAWLVKLYIRRMLAVAGLQENNLLQQQLRAQGRRKVSVIAPIEAGILDLRARFSTQQTSHFNTLVRFIIEYKIFFVGLLIIVLILYVISWFFTTVSEDNRSFEVTINGSSEDVIVDSESLEYEQQLNSGIVERRNIPPIRLINRSGVNGAAADVALVLEELGYTIESVSTELNVIERQTVIVHDPEIANDALDLSAVLNNALLSPFQLDTDKEQLITVYVGTDLVN